MEEVNWVALAYTLSYLAFTTLIARISDIVGRRDAFLGSYTIFIAISIGCGFAQNLDQLIALRAVQGFGASGESLCKRILQLTSNKSHRTRSLFHFDDHTPRDRTTKLATYSCKCHRSYHHSCQCSWACSRRSFRTLRELALDILDQVSRPG